MSVAQMRPGTISYLACLLCVLMLAMLASDWRVMWICGLSVLLAFVFYRAGLDVLRHPWLWVLVVFLVVPSALLDDHIDGSWFGVPLSQQGFFTGIQMALRATAIAITVTGFAASVSIGELASVLERIGLKGLGFALGVAVNMLPLVQETATTTYHALQMRGGFRVARRQSVRLLLITIVVNCLRHAEDIVGAAEARAFSTERITLSPIVWQRSDWIIVGGLSIVTIIMLI